MRIGVTQATSLLFFKRLNVKMASATKPREWDCLGFLSDELYYLGTLGHSSDNSNNVFDCC